MEDPHHLPFFFCVVFDVTPLSVICRIDSTSLRLGKAEYEQGPVSCRCITDAHRGKTRWFVEAAWHSLLLLGSV